MRCHRWIRVAEDRSLWEIEHVGPGQADWRWRRVGLTAGVKPARWDSPNFLDYRVDAWLHAALSAMTAPTQRDVIALWRDGPTETVT